MTEPLQGTQMDSGLQSKEASQEDLFFTGFLCSGAHSACFKGIVLSCSVHTVLYTPALTPPLNPSLEAYSS